MPATVLVTGATGLLGRHTVPELTLRGHRVLPVRRRDCDLLVPGVAAELVRRVQPDIVVHLAWVASGTADYRSSTDNARWVDTSLELFGASTRAGAHFMATGSAVDRQAAGADAYTRAKFDLWTRLEPAVRRRELAWLRPFYVFDPDQRRPAVLAAALSAAESASPLALQTPFSAHDFVHAADVGRACALLVQARALGEIPIGSGTTRTVGDFVSAAGADWHSGAQNPPTSAHQQSAADTAVLTGLGWSASHTRQFFSPPHVPSPEPSLTNEVHA